MQINNNLFEGGITMIYTLPVCLENGQAFNTLPSQSIRFSRTSGYDGSGLRVTNIVGCANGDFLKECPRCGIIKPSEAFGLRETVNRDQSNCMDCRSQY